jgi:hypothetical protein
MDKEMDMTTLTTIENERVTKPRAVERVIAGSRRRTAPA